MRTNVYKYPTIDDEYAIDGPTLDGWFDPATAEEYAEATKWDGSDNISVPTGSQWDHQLLYRTEGGRFVLHAWSQRPGDNPTYMFITADKAREWLLINEHDDAVRTHFGEIESERGPDVVDYRTLLLKCISHVGECEGVDFIGGHRGESGVTFTDDEWSTLLGLSNEASSAS